MGGVESSMTSEHRVEETGERGGMRDERDAGVEDYITEPAWEHEPLLMY